MMASNSKEQERTKEMKELEIIWETRLTPKPPFSFEHTVQKDTRFGANWYWLTPFESYEQGIMRSGFRVPETQEPVGLLVQSKGSVNQPSLEIKFFSYHSLSDFEKQQAMAVLRRSLDAERDIKEFYELSEDYPVLKQAKQDLYGARIAPLPDLLSTVMLSIVLQMASEGRTEQMLKLIYNNYGKKLEFDRHEIIVSPLAEQLRKVSEEDLRTKCKLGYRAKYIKGAASLIAEGNFPNLVNLETISSDDVKRLLMQIKGIGEFASEVVTPHPSFPVDIWSVKIFCKLFGISESRKPREMISLVKEYAKKEFGVWQKYVYEYIVNDLENLSEKFGLDL